MTKDSENEQKKPGAIEALKTSGLMILMIGVISAVVYSFSFASFQHTLDEARASQKFKATKGTVLISEVRENSGKTTNYSAFLYYTYIVDNKDYFSDRIAFPDPTFVYHSEAASMIKRYQVKHTVEVFYDPVDPQKSCLIKGVTDTLKNDQFYQPH